LPNNWKWGSSLREDRTDADGIHFQRTSLHDLVDSPMIMGEHFRKFPLEVSNIPPVTLHVTSESAAALQLPDEIVKHYGNIATEAGLMLGGGHFDRYEWLVYCSDDFPRTGLEHLKSSLNGVEERDLLTVEKLQGWAGGLLPHELVHSWCGKFRRPAGMVTPDFHTDKDTRLLWVYEGLDTYLEGVLVVRGGLWSFDRFKDDLADTLSSYKHQMGRQWRSLEDTAADSYHLRGGSQAWSKLRRNQDYYAEGALFWLEVDAIIRTKTDGRRSLDDFCKSFLGAGYPDKKVLPYELEDIIGELEALADHDWRELIEERIQRPQERLALDVVPMLGYRLQFSSTPSESLAKQEKEDEFATALDSIGMRVNEEGVIHSTLVPGMPADEAGLAPGMKIVGVNGRKFSLDRFREGIADSVVNNSIEFLVLDGDVYKTFNVDYSEGSKYLKLMRDESRTDLLAEIYSPRRAGANVDPK
jgi:predicted metalloprotease with PDZ domain